MSLCFSSVLFLISKSPFLVVSIVLIYDFLLPHHIAMQLKQVFFQIGINFQVFNANKISISSTSTTMHLAPLTLSRFPSSLLLLLFPLDLYEKPNIFLIHCITLHLLMEIIVKKGLLAALNSSHTHQHY